MPALPRGEDYGGGDTKLNVRVVSAESVTGECTYVLSRGKQRVVFELTIKLQARALAYVARRAAHVLVLLFVCLQLRVGMSA